LKSSGAGFVGNIRFHHRRALRAALYARVSALDQQTLGLQM